MFRNLAALAAMPYCAIVTALLSFSFGPLAGHFDGAMLMGVVIGGAFIGAPLVMLILDGSAK